MNLFENLQLMKESEQIKTFNISFKANNVYQANLIKGYSEEQVTEYFKSYKPHAQILGVKIATKDDKRPDKPIIDATKKLIKKDKKLQTFKEANNSVDDYFDNLVDKIQNRFHCDIDDTYYDIDNYPSEFKARFVIYNIEVNQADDIEKVIIKEVSKDYSDVKVDYEWDSMYLSNFVKDAYVYTIQAYTDTDILDEDFDFEILDTHQKIHSDKTSVNGNKLPAIVKLINLKPGTLNVDYGGGKYDNVTEYYKEQGVTSLIYDPYNRSSQHNNEVLNAVRKNGGADSVICSNVLNVIAEESARNITIQNIYNILKPGAPAYFTVHEDGGKGNSGVTSSGYQLRRKTVSYVEEIEKVFSNVKRKGKLITAIK